MADMHHTKLITGLYICSLYERMWITLKGLRYQEKLFSIFWNDAPSDYFLMIANYCIRKAISHYSPEYFVMNSRITTFLFITSVIFIFTACLESSTTVEEGQSITEITFNSPNFSTFAEALVQTDLAETLDTGGPYTVFAPENSAFSDLPQDLFDNLTDEQLTEILLYHVIETSILSVDLEAAQSVQTMQGEELFITTTGTGALVNDGTPVFQYDVFATNGVMHAVSGVLLPDTFNDITGITAKRYFLSTLAGALEETGLLETLQNPEAGFTLFAPGNDAFDNLPDGTMEGMTQDELRNLLLYHVADIRVLSSDLADGTYTLDTLSDETMEVVVASGTITINGTATVQTADLEGTNGVVHTIGSVLTP
jgi:transforming growth factor-beta-induced protein